LDMGKHEDFIRTRLEPLLNYQETVA